MRTWNAKLDLIIRQLQTSSSDEAKKLALQELKESKSRTITFVRDFREAGGTQPLVELVQSTDKKIAQHAISVFADCCREEGFQKEIRDLKCLDVPGEFVWVRSACVRACVRGCMHVMQ